MSKKIIIIVGILIVTGAGFLWYKNSLKDINSEPVVSEYKEISGYLTIGAEVRTFRECGEGKPDNWIVAEPDVYKKIIDTYNKETSDVLLSAYAPLFAKVSGKMVPAPTDGFGSDYAGGIQIERLISVDREGNCKIDKIVLNSPHAGATVSSPILIEGMARGTWFFEASFPVFLTDWDGKIIGQGIAQAQSEWMTEEFVPFKAEIKFVPSFLKESYSNKATLILKKDNPSGLPEYDDSIEIPLFLK